MGSMSQSSPRGEFWNVSEDLNGQGVQFDPTDETAGVLFDWEYGRDLLTGRRSPSAPLVFRQVRKSRWYDMLWSGESQIRIVSSRLIGVLKAERATGWRTYPVTLWNKKGARVPGYQGLAITGIAGPIQWNRAERLWHPPAVPTGEGSWMLRGPLIDEQTWDGSDLFFPGGTMHLMVTARIVRAMRKSELKGIEYTHQSKFEISEETVKGLLRRRREGK